ncbi:helix-turn-helix domain-containing protein [Kineococcus sp. SYSU DK005]|uniref:hypothetical protein n=1 Tax=Kineococcus sp. SYSU DK005 TaxID=3383126 RepID=UPI003D7D62C7
MLTAQAVNAALAHGAVGVLAVDTPLETAVRVVQAAAQGWVLLPAPVAHALGSTSTTAGTTAGDASTGSAAGVALEAAPRTTPLERAWLRALGAGTTVAALARGRACGEGEVYRSLGALYQRLGAANRTQALLIAQRWGLLEERAADEEAADEQSLHEEPVHQEPVHEEPVREELAHAQTRRDG